MPPLQEPYLATYTQEDHRSPSKPFDPKAVTRASWEPTRKKKPKKNGPLLSFNRHRECVAFARSEQGHQTFALTLYAPNTQVPKPLCLTETVTKGL